MDLKKLCKSNKRVSWRVDLSTLYKPTPWERPLDNIRMEEKNMHSGHFLKMPSYVPNEMPSD